MLLLQFSGLFDEAIRLTRNNSEDNQNIFLIKQGHQDLLLNERFDMKISVKSFVKVASDNE